MKYSGIGGQAVLEGIMMKNRERYAVAVRKPDGTIETKEDSYQSFADRHQWAGYPFIRATDVISYTVTDFLKAAAVI